MKNYFHLNPGTAASQAAHKVIAQRGHSAKTATHRYERRKVRELLRQGNPAIDGNDI